MTFVFGKILLVWSGPILAASQVSTKQNFYMYRGVHVHVLIANLHPLLKASSPKRHPVHSLQAGVRTENPLPLPSQTPATQTVQFNALNSEIVYHD